VIAIIAILAAILFPVFARARENARRASCQSNLKQIALGVKQYMQDYDDLFPPVAQRFGESYAGEPYMGWTTLTQPYLKSRQIFQCPSQPNRDGGPFNGQDSWGSSDYFYNGNLGWPRTSSTDCNNQKFTVKEAEVDSSSNVILLGDGGRGGEHNIANCADYAASPSVAGGIQANQIYRKGYCYTPGWFTRSLTDINAYATTADNQATRETHLGGMNIAFVDGHVKWLKPEKLTFDDPNGANVTFKVNAINGGTGPGKVGCTS
jgi:prepilin-type processing-associated H-X9-DG protein